MIEQTNTELIAKANAVSTNDVVANPRRYRTMIHHLAAALEQATRELEEADHELEEAEKDLEDESGRANDAVIAHNRSTTRAEQAEVTLAKVRDLPRYSVIEGDRAWSAVDADDLAAILDEAAPHPAPIEAGEREALEQMTLDESAPEYEVLSYLITAFRIRERELRGPITPELVKVSEPMADFLVANGFHRRPPVDEAEPVEEEEREALANLIPLGFRAQDGVRNVVEAADRILAAGFRRYTAPIEAGEREALFKTVRRAIGDEDYGPQAWHLVTEAVIAAGFRRAPIEDAEPVAYERRDRETGKSAGVVTARCLSESDRNCYDLTPLYHHPHHSAKTETTTIKYCPEHGDLLSHYRSWRCEKAHSVDEIRKNY